MSTHLGQPPENHVVLESLIFPEGWVDWERNFPDGTHSGYRVPVGMMLVITDVDWHYESSEPGSTQTFRLFLVATGRDPVLESILPAHQSIVFESPVVTGPLGSGGASVAMTTGFVVSSTARIRCDVYPSRAGLQHVNLRGYLTPESPQGHGGRGRNRGGADKDQHTTQADSSRVDSGPALADDTCLGPHE